MSAARNWARGLLIGFGVLMAVFVAMIVYVLAAPAGAPRPFYVAIDRRGAVVASDLKALDELMSHAPAAERRRPKAAPPGRT